MRVTHRLGQAQRHVPALQQPRADLGVVMAELLALVRREFAVLALQLAGAAVEFRYGTIQGEDADVLHEAGEEQLLEERVSGGLAQAARGDPAQEAAPPVERVVHAVGLGAAQRLDQRKRQGQRERRVQAEHDQCLAQGLAAPSLGVERRVGDAQHLRDERRVHRDRGGDPPEVEVGVLGEFDQPRRHAGRGRKAGERAQVSVEFWRHARAASGAWIRAEPAGSAGRDPLLL